MSTKATPFLLPDLGKGSKSKYSRLSKSKQVAPKGSDSRADHDHTSVIMLCSGVFFVFCLKPIKDQRDALGRVFPRPALAIPPPPGADFFYFFIFPIFGKLSLPKAAVHISIYRTVFAPFGTRKIHASRKLKPPAKYTNNPSCLKALCVIQ